MPANPYEHGRDDGLRAFTCASTTHPGAVCGHLTAVPTELHAAPAASPATGSIQEHEHTRVVVGAVTQPCGPLSDHEVRAGVRKQPRQRGGLSAQVNRRTASQLAARRPVQLRARARPQRVADNEHWLVGDRIASSQGIEARLQRPAQPDYLPMDLFIDLDRRAVLSAEFGHRYPGSQLLWRGHAVDHLPILEHHGVDEVKRDVTAEEHERVRRHARTGT